MLVTEKKSLKVGRFVNTDHVDQAISNYKQKRWVENSRRLGKEDSLSVWYSVEELEEFIGKIKENGGDGIRMYFGVYSDNYPENPLYAGRQTIVMVATKQKQTLKGSTDKDLYINEGEKANILAYNAGKVCPPFCRPIEGGEGMGDLGISLVDKGDDGFVVI